MPLNAQLQDCLSVPEKSFCACPAPGVGGGGGSIHHALKYPETTCKAINFHARPASSSTLIYPHVTGIWSLPQGLIHCLTCCTAAYLRRGPNVALRLRAIECFLACLGQLSPSLGAS